MLTIEVIKSRIWLVGSIRVLLYQLYQWSISLLVIVFQNRSDLVARNVMIRSRKNCIHATTTETVWFGLLQIWARLDQYDLKLHTRYDLLRFRFLACGKLVECALVTFMYHDMRWGVLSIHSILWSCWFMMTSSNGKIFPRYRPFMSGIHRTPMNSPHKGQWRGA